MGVDPIAVLKLIQGKDVIIEELEEENQKLKECNKNQSEVINNVFIPQKERLEEENQKLKEENQKLKEKLEHIKETYIRFEDSEKEYNKGLGELDQLIMNR